MKGQYFIKYNVPERLSAIKLMIGMVGEVNDETREISDEYNNKLDSTNPHISGWDCVIFKPKALGLTGHKNIKVMVPRGYGESEYQISSRDPIVANPPMLVVRAKFSSSPVYVFLSRDSWYRKGESGSVYYWSNNMALISYPKFHTEEEALKFVKRLKIKSQVTDIKVVEYIPGAQLFYYDGKIV